MIRCDCLFFHLHNLIADARFVVSKKVCFDSSTALPLRILLLHPLLILRIPFSLCVAHILNPAAGACTTGALEQLAALRIVVSGLFDCGLAKLLSGRLDCCAVDRIGSGLVHAVVAGCLLAVGSSAAAAREGGAEGGAAGEVVGGHCCGEELLFAGCLTEVL